jgi:hypothetical protein
MELSQAFDSIPLVGIFLCTVIITLVSLEVGFFQGRKKARDPTHEKDSLVGSISGTTLGLLAFLLAFTFGMAVTRFDTRRLMVLDEANAIGTTYLRAGILPEPSRSEIRHLLKEYVDVRVKSVEQNKIREGMVQSERLLDKLWAEANSIGEKNPNSIVVGLFIQTMNETIDLHEKRVMMGIHNRLPGVIWVVLYFISILGMASIGYYAGLMEKRSVIANLVLTLTFSIVLVLVVDLDRPQHGLIRTGQAPMIDLQNKLNKPESPAP